MQCGANPADPRSHLYFTSVIKCVCAEDKFFGVMAQRCRSFLHRQIEVIRPQLVITLGEKAYQALRVSEESYDEALCIPRDSAEFVLLTQFGFHFSLLHWPHPSGLNRWHNKEANAKRLAASFDFVRTFLEEVHATP